MSDNHCWPGTEHIQNTRRQITSKQVTQKNFLIYSRVTNLVRLSTLNRPGMDYEPGDHLYIFPSNNEEQVGELLRHLQCYDVKPEDVINIQHLTGELKLIFVSSRLKMHSKK